MKTKKKTKYNADYFIRFFSRIPAKKFCTNKESNGRGQYCAFGHLRRLGKEDEWNKFRAPMGSTVDSVVYANDSRSISFNQPKIKDRVVAYCKYLKSLGY